MDVATSPVHPRLRGLPAPRRHRPGRGVRRRQRRAGRHGLRPAHRVAGRRRRGVELRASPSQTAGIGGQPDTLLVAGGSRGLKAVMARARSPPLAAQGGAARPGATARSAPAPSCWRRPACSTASGWPRTGRAASAWRERFPAAHRRCRVALRRRRQGVDLGRRDHRHRHGARPGRGRPRRGDRQPDRTPFRALCATAGLSVAVQPAPAGADQGRGAVRAIDRLDAGQSRPADSTFRSLAARAGLSERSFYRKFTQATGKTPAHFVESLRLEAARTLLAKGLPLKAIAGQVGLDSSARLGQAFERRFGMAPSLFREMHRVRMDHGGAGLKLAVGDVAQHA